MQWHVGTSGFSYKEWKGSFYPEDLKPAEMLAYYAQHLTTVEINNTFYRMPKKEVLQRWAADVPEGFSFVIKAPQRITHRSRLKDVADPLEYLWNTLQALGAKLGPLLFQLPPYFKADLERLEAFLESLPQGLRAVFEFRHASWNEPTTCELLAKHGVALCIADTDEAPDPPIQETSDWGYLRLRRAAYDEALLVSWIERVRATGWHEAYVFFKHEDAGVGPRLAEQWLELVE